MCGTAQYKENLDLRMKFSDQPLRYLDSEVDLVDTIKGLMQVRKALDNIKKWSAATLGKRLLLCQGTNAYVAGTESEFFLCA